MDCRDKADPDAVTNGFRRVHSCGLRSEFSPRDRYFRSLRYQLAVLDGESPAFIDNNQQSKQHRSERQAFAQAAGQNEGERCAR